MILYCNLYNNSNYKGCIGNLCSLDIENINDLYNKMYLSDKSKFDVFINDQKFPECIERYIEEYNEVYAVFSLGLVNMMKTEYYFLINETDRKLLRDLICDKKIEFDTKDSDLFSKLNEAYKLMMIVINLDMQVRNICENMKVGENCYFGKKACILLPSEQKNVAEIYDSCFAKSGIWKMIIAHPNSRINKIHKQLTELVVKGASVLSDLSVGGDYSHCDLTVILNNSDNRDNDVVLNAILKKFKKVTFVINDKITEINRKMVIDFKDENIITNHGAKVFVDSREFMSSIKKYSSLFDGVACNYVYMNRGDYYDLEEVGFAYRYAHNKDSKNYGDCYIYHTSDEVINCIQGKTEIKYDRSSNYGTYIKYMSAYGIKKYVDYYDILVGLHGEMCLNDKLKFDEKFSKNEVLKNVFTSKVNQFAFEKYLKSKFDNKTFKDLVNEFIDRYNKTYDFVNGDFVGMLKMEHCFGLSAQDRILFRDLMSQKIVFDDVNIFDQLCSAYELMRIIYKLIKQIENVFANFKIGEVFFLNKDACPLLSSEQSDIAEVYESCFVEHGITKLIITNPNSRINAIDKQLTELVVLNPSIISDLSVDGDYSHCNLTVVLNNSIPRGNDLKLNAILKKFKKVTFVINDKITEINGKYILNSKEQLKSSKKPKIFVDYKEFMSHVQKYDVLFDGVRCQYQYMSNGAYYGLNEIGFAYNYDSDKCYYSFYTIDDLNENLQGSIDRIIELLCRNGGSAFHDVSKYKHFYENDIVNQDIVDLFIKVKENYDVSNKDVFTNYCFREKFDLLYKLDDQIKGYCGKYSYLSEKVNVDNIIDECFRDAVKAIINKHKEIHKNTLITIENVYKQDDLKNIYIVGGALRDVPHGVENIFLQDAKVAALLGSNENSGYKYSKLTNVYINVTDFDYSYTQDGLLQMCKVIPDNCRIIFLLRGDEEDVNKTLKQVVSYLEEHKINLDIDIVKYNHMILSNDNMIYDSNAKLLKSYCGNVEIDDLTQQICVDGLLLARGKYIIVNQLRRLNQIATKIDLKNKDRFLANINRNRLYIEQFINKYKATKTLFCNNFVNVGEDNYIWKNEYSFLLSNEDWDLFRNLVNMEIKPEDTNLFDKLNDVFVLLKIMDKFVYGINNVIFEISKFDLSESLYLVEGYELYPLILHFDDDDIASIYNKDLTNVSKLVLTHSNARISTIPKGLKELIVSNFNILSNLNANDDFSHCDLTVMLDCNQSPAALIKEFVDRNEKMHKLFADGSKREIKDLWPIKSVDKFRNIFNKFKSVTFVLSDGKRRQIDSENIHSKLDPQLKIFVDEDDFMSFMQIASFTDGVKCNYKYMDGGDYYMYDMKDIGFCEKKRPADLHYDCYNTIGCVSREFESRLRSVDREFKFDGEIEVIGDAPHSAVRSSYVVNEDIVDLYKKLKNIYDNSNKNVFTNYWMLCKLEFLQKIYDTIISSCKTYVKSGHKYKFLSNINDHLFVDSYNGACYDDFFIGECRKIAEKYLNLFKGYMIIDGHTDLRSDFGDRNDVKNVRIGKDGIRDLPRNVENLFASDAKKFILLGRNSFEEPALKYSKLTNVYINVESFGATVTQEGFENLCKIIPANCKITFLLRGDEEDVSKKLNQVVFYFEKHKINFDIDIVKYNYMILSGDNMRCDANAQLLRSYKYENGSYKMTEMKGKLNTKINDGKKSDDVVKDPLLNNSNKDDGKKSDDSGKNTLIDGSSNSQNNDESHVEANGNDSRGGWFIGLLVCLVVLGYIWFSSDLKLSIKYNNEL